MVKPRAAVDPPCAKPGPLSTSAGMPECLVTLTGCNLHAASCCWDDRALSEPLSSTCCAAELAQAYRRASLASVASLLAPVAGVGDAPLLEEGGGGACLAQAQLQLH